MTKSFFLALLLTILLASNGFAQDVSTFGHAQRPHLKSGQAAILLEEIRMHIDDERTTIDASYTISSPTRISEFLSFGLPAHSKEDYEDVSVFYDQTPVPVRQWADEIVVVRDSDGYDYSDNIPVHWWLWNNELLPGEEHVLTLRYAIPANRQSIQKESVLAARINEEFAAKGWKISSTVERLVRNLPHNGTGYAVHRASGWKDRPERTRLIVSWPDDRGMQTWEGEGLAAGQEVQVDGRLPDARSHLHQLLLGAVATYPESRSLRALRTAQLALPQLKPSRMPENAGVQGKQ